MRILLADDHPLFREGLKPVLAKLDAEVELVEAMDYPTAFATMHRMRHLHGGVDLALLDLYMPGMDGVEGILRFRAAFPDIPVVVLSAAEQVMDIQKLLAAGALGYITKASPSDVILSALRLVLAGGVFIPPSLLDRPGVPVGLSTHVRNSALTSRQIEVLGELAKGLSNKQIAKTLEVTEGTVKIHLAAIFRSLQVNNRTEAVLVAQKMGLHKRR
ncbi:MAG TPA: response regulator transcription factor [Thiobacillaceae bacterium]|nr:response regulator transcription factor [Thiobacillaceae bacterium]HNU64507.1 response regulator transcription factor [Thiobacillaceae bacterium]